MLRTMLATVVLATGVMLGTQPEAQAQRLIPCAREHGFCRVPYPTRVIYGIPGRSAEVFVRGGGVPCSNRVFGDPAPGVVKRCSYVARRFDRGYRGYEDEYRGPPRGYRREFRERDFRSYDEDFRRPFSDFDRY